MFRSLGKVRWIHRIAGATGLYGLANGLLARCPVVVKLPRHATVLRVDSIAGFALRDELFRQNVYAQAIEGYSISTFIDVGCNVGWFPCVLRESTGRRDFVGLLVDADKGCVEKAQWHLKTNGLSACTAEWGAVGVESTASDSEFYLNPANTQSSLLPPAADHPIPVKGRVRTVKVPRYELAERWRYFHGQKSVDLMKVDVEGAELTFLRQEADFIKAQVRRLVCEWHSWRIGKLQLIETLARCGLTLTGVCSEDEWGGVLVADNHSPRP